MRLYLDAAPVIYAVEGTSAYAAVVDAHLSQPGLTLVCSHLTRLECRVKPLKNGDAALLSDFDRFFTEVVGEFAELTQEVFDYATGVRANYGFKTPDALHIAAAVVLKCDAFLTNDHQLDSFTDLRIIVVEP